MRTITTDTGRELLIVSVPHNVTCELKEVPEVKATSINTFTENAIYYMGPQWVWGLGHKVVGNITKIEGRCTFDFDPEKYINSIMFDNEEDCKEKFIEMIESNGFLTKNPYDELDTPDKIMKMRFQLPEDLSEYEAKYEEAEKKVFQKLIVIEKTS